MSFGFSPVKGAGGLALTLLGIGCAGASASARVSSLAVASGARPRVGDGLTERDRAREVLLEGLRDTRDPSRAGSLGLRLAAAHGARALTGEPSADERLRSVTLLTRTGDAMALLALSDCGNAWLVAMRWTAGRWEPAERVGLVDDARPGRCRTTEARAESRAMTSRSPREIVAVYGSQSEEGDESRPPALRVFQLGEGGSLGALSEPLGFGSDGDASGVPEYGEWIVDEALSLPRDLFVEIRPRVLVRGGPRETVRRVYRVAGGRLVQIDESRARVPP